MPDEEYLKSLRANMQRNSKYAAPGSYFTALQPQDESAFREWVKKNNVPFNPRDAITDYDMRGFWKALQAGDPIAKSAIDPYDKKLHYPDRWKTPYHETFSNESQWAMPGAPAWSPEGQLVDPRGQVLYDSRTPH